MIVIDGVVVSELWDMSGSMDAPPLIDGDAVREGLNKLVAFGVHTV